MQSDRSIKLFLALVGFCVVLPVAGQAQTMYRPYYYGTQQPYQQATPVQATSHLETFQYDPKLDPRNQAYITPTANDPSPAGINAIGLDTKSGIDVGLQISDYAYREPSLGVKLDGSKYGITIDGFGKLDYGVFLGVETRFAAGNSDYAGSGTHSGNFEDLFDARILLGKDVIFTRYALAPFTGIGFRHFYSDDRGVTSTGFYGYRRVNNLVYLPIGVKPRFRVTSESRITTSLEFDAVMKGLQMTMASDVNPGVTDIHNKQSGGFGIRAGAMWEHQSWGLGPFLTYWDIPQSDTQCNSSYTLCGDEPANHTLEIGLQFRYHFL